MTWPGTTSRVDGEQERRATHRAQGVPVAERTLPASEYVSEEAYQRERDVIFGHAWQLAGFSTDLQNPGSYVTAMLGDRSFVVVRGNDGRLNAFHNVCMHRGAEVASGTGLRRTLQCPYHGWTYGLDGILCGAPGLSAPLPDVRLRAASVVERAPFVFVSPSTAPPDFDAHFGSLFDFLDAEGVDTTGIASHGTRQIRKFEIEANWKVVMENSLECYHCSIAHPGLAATLDLRQYEYQLDRWWSVQGAPMRDVSPHSSSALGDATRIAAGQAGGFSASRFIFLYPNLFLEIYPGPASFATLSILPVNRGQTRTIHTKFMRTPMSPTEEREWNAFVEQVITEDVALCESVQRGLRSGAIDEGIINIAGRGANEACVGHFDALVAEANGMPVAMHARTSPAQLPRDLGR